MQPSSPCPSTPNPPTQPLARHLAAARHLSNPTTTTTRTRGQWAVWRQQKRKREKEQRVLIFSLGASAINAFSLRTVWLACAELSSRGFAQRDATRFVKPRPVQSDAVFEIIGLQNVERERREPCYSAAVNTILQLRTISLLSSILIFLAPPFLSFFVFNFELVWSELGLGDGRARGKAKRHCERTNEQQPLRGVLGTLDRSSFSVLPQPTFTIRYSSAASFLFFSVN